MKSFLSYLGSICLALLLQHASWANTPSTAEMEQKQADERWYRAIEDHKKSFRLMVQVLKKHHYRKDDNRDLEIFNDYIQYLDSNRLYFSQDEIQAMKSLLSASINDLNDDDLTAAFSIYQMYRENAQALNEWSIERLNQPFDLNREDEVHYPYYEGHLERITRPFEASRAAIHAQQEKRLQDQLIRLMLAGKSEEEARQSLLERYQRSLKSLKQIEAQDIFDIYMNVVAGHFDPHTAYLSPRSSEDFDINMSLSLQGIGAVLSRQEDRTLIRELIAGGPAAKSGLIKVKDQILAVGQGQDGEMIDVVGMRLDKTVNYIRGKKGSTVRLLIESNGETREVQLIRDEIKLEEQAATYTIETLNGKRFGLIDLPSFYMDFDGARQGKKDFRSTSRDLSRILTALKKEKVDGVILDLRNNGGGSLIEAIASVGLFIDTGAVVVIQDQEENRKEERDEDRGAIYNGPLMVLISEHSASASEIFAAAIQDYQRGIVVGHNSYGKGTVQTLTPLKRFSLGSDKDLGSVKFTTSMFFRVNGYSTQLHGVKPDISLPSNEHLNAVGELAQAYPLPWRSIKAADIKAYAYLDAARLNELERAHQQRLQDIGAFRLHAERMAYELAQSKLRIAPASNAAAFIVYSFNLL